MLHKVVPILRTSDARAHFYVYCLVMFTYESFDVMAFSDELASSVIRNSRLFIVMEAMKAIPTVPGRAVPVVIKEDLGKHGEVPGLGLTGTFYALYTAQFD